MTNFYANFNIPRIYGAVSGNISRAASPAMQQSVVPSINMGPAADVFQKSTAVLQSTVPVSQSAPVSSVWDNKRIQAIYDKTYETVMAQNPITKELNISKPPLNFDSSDESESALATYISGINKIRIHDKSYFENDIYLCKFSDARGEIIDIKILGQKDADEASKKNPEYTVSKEILNDAEKELYISSVFAHELRHCIQAHLLFSTKGCAEEYKEQLLDLKTAYERLIETKKEIAALKEEPYIPGEEDEDLEKLNYGLNYRPKKLLPAESLFKFSLLPTDNRYFSIKDHLLPASKEKQEDQEAYYNNPLEIDAYNYEYEFFMKQTENYPTHTLRKDVLHNMRIALMLNVSDSEFSFIRQ